MHTQEYKATKKQIVRLQCVCVFVCVCVGGAFEIGRPTSRGWNNFGRRWGKGVGNGQFSWTSYVYHPFSETSRDHPHVMNVKHFQIITFHLT